MNFDFTGYDGFRQEIHDYCLERWPAGFAPRVWPDGHRGPTWGLAYRESMKSLAAKGWLCGAWPVAYGGEGWNILKQAVFNDEAAYHGIPGTGLTNSGTSIIGPTLMHYGTPEQKDTYLPGIASGRIRFGLGFSEPNAGSDLAGLQTRATANGDEFVINGAKIWNHSLDTDYLLLLARTDPDAPKHKGISQFILPLKDNPGVTIQPIRDLRHEDRWTLVTFEDVRLPRGNLIGEINRGWYQETTSLDYERAQMGWLGEARRTLEEIIRLTKRHQRNGAALLTNTFVRDRLGELATELEMARWLAYRVAYMQEQGLVPNSEASMSKLWSSEVQQRIQRAGMTLTGITGMISGGAHSIDGGNWEYEFWDATGATIAGGASEIQRNIISQRGLGLPR